MHVQQINPYWITKHYTNQMNKKFSKGEQGLLKKTCKTRRYVIPILTPHHMPDHHKAKMLCRPRVKIGICGLHYHIPSCFVGFFSDPYPLLKFSSIVMTSPLTLNRHQYCSHPIRAVNEYTQQLYTTKKTSKFLKLKKKLSSM